MESNTVIGILLMLCSVVITAASQVLLKIAARRKYKTAGQEYINPFVIVAYGLFFVTTLCTVTALRFIPMSLSTAVGAMVQISVPLASFIFLKEKISKRRCIGMIIITVGVLIFCL